VNEYFSVDKVKVWSYFLRQFLCSLSKLIQGYVEVDLFELAYACKL